MSGIYTIGMLILCYLFYLLFKRMLTDAKKTQQAGHRKFVWWLYNITYSIFIVFESVQIITMGYATYPYEDNGALCNRILRSFCFNFQKK